MTATLLTVAELRQHVETDLPDAALQRILDAEEAEIVSRYGAHASQVEVWPGNGEWIMLMRRPASITAVAETADDVTTTLASDDYRLWPAGGLERLATGTNPRAYWAELVTVTYVPQDVSAQRIGALIRLATLTARYTGQKSESVGAGDYSMSALDYTAERERLLRRLAGRSLWIQ